MSEDANSRLLSSFCTIRSTEPASISWGTALIEIWLPTFPTHLLDRRKAQGSRTERFSLLKNRVRVITCTNLVKWTPFPYAHAKTLVNKVLRTSISNKLIWKGEGWTTCLLRLTRISFAMMILRIINNISTLGGWTGGQENRKITMTLLWDKYIGR